MIYLDEIARFLSRKTDRKPIKTHKNSVGIIPESIGVKILSGRMIDFERENKTVFPFYIQFPLTVQLLDTL